MDGSTAFERFILYRFDYASMVVDAVRALASNDYKISARLVSIPIAALLLAPPVLTFVEARRPFGSQILFALLIVIWPWILELPGLAIRQTQVEPAWPQRKVARTYDWFMHIGLGLIAIAAIVCLMLEPKVWSDLELAALWAIALAGGADMVRSLTALCLASLRGFPLYGLRSRNMDG
jgi:hypothetical protein